MKHQIDSRADIDFAEGEPRRALSRWLESGGADLLLVDFQFTPWWLEGAAGQRLTAVYCREGDRISVAVTDIALSTTDLPAREQYRAWIEEHGLFSAALDAVLPLSPVHIPKPWGQEIWYTGVEQRGVCHFGAPGRSVPIPWLQAALPEGYGGDGPLVLLKILDPDSAEVTGDLYFELHQEKREVYVVTHVDRDAWPDGRGYIRYGFDPGKLADFGDEGAFRLAYREAVSAYEAVRREIDANPDATQGASELLERERELRLEMDSFTHLRALEVGDVVEVPLLLPHSLQHGVRTVEFQTPVYERKILSFAQKVLTQDHWDTEEATAQMQLLPPEDKPFEILHRGRGSLVERVVDFPDFEVRRVRVEGGGSLALPLEYSYGLVMLVEGELEIDGSHFGPEQAFLVPRGRSLGVAPAQAAQPLVLLLALPRS